MYVLGHVLKAWALIDPRRCNFRLSQRDIPSSSFPHAPSHHLRIRGTSSDFQVLSAIELWVAQGKFWDRFQSTAGLQLSYLSSILSGRLRECDTTISRYQKDLSLLPRSAPLRALGVYGLALARLVRYLLSSQQDALEQSILGSASQKQYTSHFLRIRFPHPRHGSDILLPYNRLFSLRQ